MFLVLETIIVAKHLTGKTFATINPSTGEEICQVSEAGVTDVEKTVKVARTASELGPWRCAGC
jgi:acyl-CoA reductase-like NAD-dependent aldehyde dehydrogenase